MEGVLVAFVAATPIERVPLGESCDGLRPPLIPHTAKPPLNSTMNLPINIQLIGQEVAIVWDDGTESYFPFEKLRAASPSASNLGERDVLGNRYGGDGPKSFPGVQVLGWERVGNYALRFDFSDGHRTGLYSFDYLRALAAG
jgi:DUF971 family protein